MNNVQLVGRLTSDPNMRYTDGGLTIARFNLACDRRFKKDGEQSADFISCIAFGKTADFIEKYFKKGNRLGLIGRIQTGSYEKDGKKVYTTDVVAEAVEFVESKGSASAGESKSSSGAAAKPEPQSADGFIDVPEGLEEELPFS